MTAYLVLTGSAGVSDEIAGALAADPALVARRAGPLRRLGPDALDMPLTGTATLPAALRAQAAAAGVDANLVPAAARDVRMLIADMDSTIITVECIDELADYAGVGAQVASITERAMRGELDFDGALRARVGLMAGLPESALEQCHAERVTLTPGAQAMVAGLTRAGAHCALVSGGFTWFAARVAQAAGFGFCRANTLLFENGRLTGKVAEPILGRAAKRDTLLELCAQHGFSPAQVVAIGDGANDLDMIRTAGLGIAWRAKPVLAEAADARLDHSDLTAVLALLGLPTES